MITRHIEGRYTMTPGRYELRDPEDERRDPFLDVYGFSVDEGGGVRVLSENTAIRPLARTVVRHYYVPRADR